MSDIDVEPVERDEADDDASLAVEVTDSAELPSGVDAPEYVLYGGKGGVGKTTMAAATALASANDGTATLVVSTDPAHSLSDTLGTDVPPEPGRVREDVPLYAAEIDPDESMNGLFGDTADGAGTGVGEAGFDGAEGTGVGGDADGPMGELGDLLGGGMDPFGGPMPGADEAAAMQQLLRYLDDDRFERVVVDTAPTGHTLRLLQLPEVMESMVGRLLRMRERFSGMVEGVTGLFGGDDGGAESPDLDELKRRIERLRRVLRDPARTDFRVVLVPERMSVVESERLVARLSEFGIPVDTVVVNRVMEDLASVADLDVDEGWVVSPDLDGCAFCQRRWSVQQDALSRATDLFRGRTVKRVPLLADEVRGDGALRVVAACLD